MPAKSVFASADCAALRTRVARLQAGAAPAWGRMNCEQMLAHVSDAIRMALGDLRVEARGPRLLALAPVRHAIVYWLPFPKGAPTAPELLAREAGVFQQEQAALDALLALAGASEQGSWAPAHPAFGPLSVRDWGVLVYKHVDHHLRQFGV